MTMRELWRCGREPKCGATITALSPPSPVTKTTSPIITATSTQLPLIKSTSIHVDH